MNLVYHNSKSFFRGVCDDLIDTASTCISKSGKFILVLSGGNTPIHIFKMLSSTYLDAINWGLVHFFWVDERCVVTSHKESNFGNAEKFFLQRLSEKGSVNRIKGELPPQEAAKSYQKCISKFLVEHHLYCFDYCLLGMGEDGHVASLFPYESNTDVGDQVCFTDKKHNGLYRVSLKREFINRSKEKILLVNTRKKIDILKSNDLKYPISHIDITKRFVLDE